MTVWAAIAGSPGVAQATHGAPLQLLTQQNGDGTSLAPGAMAAARSRSRPGPRRG